ncbi:MAG TPA: enoyl-CoA hydratase [Acidisoma sp.]|uniref:enoyl-CoA hydratase n=1 Tax=Acidisoma sp. TaxID=1872115 RepID=UPI002B59525E|nr:enoyl-CoA hydratase [Acidisoma sp.]HTI02738.1 enoyl-CoA hydratase [Acidisoma sp.]
MDPSTLTCLILEREEGFAILTLNRPQALNALNNQMMDEMSAVIPALDADPGVRAIILTGSEKAFAAGADIKEMAGKSFAEAVSEDFITRNWEAVTRCRTPVIAAVAGYALGGGCELAMMCDIILAADTARFGQPEITLGIPPGAGGTQRLPRAIGKAHAMEMILTGRMMDAAEAERAGLVSRVVPAEKLMEEARAVARKIAGLSPLTTQLAKELVNAAYETLLAQGIRQERRTFHAAFATEDQKEGMAAFIEKRKAAFTGR